MLSIPGYIITEMVYESTNSLVYRGHRQHDSLPVILKMLRSDYPSPAEIVWLQHEYHILQSLDLPGVITAHALETTPRWMLVLEDIGGESLDRLIPVGGVDLAMFFALVLPIAETLGQIHQRRMIHKDLNPANVVLNPATLRVCLIDFGISTTLESEHIAFRHPKVLEGTLHYMSPEQTGRMNRAIDYRTDFYSLGVTCYELLTGSLPFGGEEPLELVHSHIARMPLPPHRLRSDISPALSAVVLKLLSKNATDRYQSARGIAADLAFIQQHLTNPAELANFVPGAHDAPERLLLPQKLYGREREVSDLLAAFERVSQGANVVMLITGAAGTGKTSLVAEAYQPITRQNGYFVSGKFDQLQCHTPYAALIQACRTLARHLLTEDERQLAAWRERLRAALNANSRVICEVIPELELILGPQEPPPDLDPIEARNRFNLVLRQFLRLFAQPQHPLVLVLDDMQWADRASLEFIEAALTTATSPYMLLIGTYRDTEVGPDHPLLCVRQALEQSGVQVQRVQLTSLQPHHITQMVCDALVCPPTASQPLAELLAAKTGGNPFALRELLHTLADEGLILFDDVRGCWSWELETIREHDLADNVVELLAERVQRLAAPTVAVLQLAACIGNRFDLATLALVAQQPAADVAHALVAALHEDIIIPLGTTYRVAEVSRDAALTEVEAEYRFTHDRVQQAVYEQMDSAERCTTHWHIGKLLLDHTAPEQREERLFDIVFQLNQCQPHRMSPAERRDVAWLNVQAGQKAKESAAYEPAFRYLQAGLALLDDASWQQDYDLTLTLYTEAAEAAYLVGESATLEQCAATVLQRARGLLDTVEMHDILIRSYASCGMMHAAIGQALPVLEQLGEPLLAKPTPADTAHELQQTAALLAAHPFDTLAHLPPLTDPHRLAALRLMARIAAPVYLGMPTLVPVLACRMVRLSVLHGSNPAALFAYTAYGLVLVSVDHIEDGSRCGMLALCMLEQAGAAASSVRTRIVHTVSLHIRHWREHIREAMPHLLEAYHSGLETGDFEFGGYAAYSYGSLGLLAGNALPHLEQEVASYSEAIARLHQSTSLGYNRLFHQVICNLLGHTAQPHYLRGVHYEPEELLPPPTTTNERLMHFYFHALSAMLCYLFEHYDQALEHSAAAAHHTDYAAGIPYMATWVWFDSLARLAVVGAAPDDASVRAVEARISANQARLDHWAQHAPMNQRHRWHLVEAERARLAGRDGDAREHYDHAIALAKEHAYLNDEALACECASRFYREKHLTQQSDLYLRNAYYAYLRWGAQAKVRALAAQHPQLEARPGAAGSRTSRTTPRIQTDHEGAHAFDFTSIIKASQAISGEIMLDTLLHKLMYVLIENAGAQRGVLLLEEADAWTVQAEAVINREEFVLLMALPVAEAALPLSVINYVIHTGQHVVLDDATVSEDFAHDPYIQRQQTYSLLCLPLHHHGTLLGLLYVENSLTRGVFNDERLEVLHLLSGQVAISIENARLYQRMQELVLGLQRSSSELAQAYDATLEGWVRMLDLRDNETEGHSQRVTQMAVQLGRAYGLSEADLVHVRRGALLHDIGKMAIPDAILHKPGPLSPAEWVLMQQHPTYAYELLAPIRFLYPAIDIPHYHHEKWDGSGYPHGLCGEAIPLFARIFAVADVWDALRSDRPYRPAWPVEQVYAYLREQAGRHFDPCIVELFFQQFPLC
jgi:predicted ATPase/HD-GYP domain-containing protein (c-di-GMP phosphodiesterase class II)